MKSYKEVFQERYELLMDEDITEDERIQLAGESAQEYIEGYGEYLYEMKKDKFWGSD